MPANSINLLPQTDFDQTPLGRLLRWALTYGRYIIICTEVIVLLAFIYRFSLDRKITDLEEEIAEKSAIIEANRGFEKQFRNLQNRTYEIGKVLQNPNQSVALLEHFEQITPLGVHFSSFTFTGKTIAIDASANTNIDLAQFLSNVRLSELLSRVNVTKLSKESAGTGVTVFQINADVRASSPNNQISSLHL